MSQTHSVQKHKKKRIPSSQILITLKMIYLLIQWYTENCVAERKEKKKSATREDLISN